MRPPLPVRRDARGFTLLEALVTIVIISIGLLGLLGLQTVSIVNTQISSARSQASIAANNMADRIRANAVGAAAGDYGAIEPPSRSNDDNSSNSAPCSPAAPCSPSDMAAYDGREWNRSLAKHLPDGRGYVTCNTLPVSGSGCLNYEITVVWHERNRHNAAASDQCAARNDIQDRCFQTEVRP